MSGYRLCKSICLKFPRRWSMATSRRLCPLCGPAILFICRDEKKDGKPFSGKVGQEITSAEGRQAARDVAIELLATLHGALHDLNRVKRIVRLLVLVNSAPGFTEPHEVANGASELFLASAARMPAARLARRRSHSAPVW